MSAFDRRSFLKTTAATTGLALSGLQCGPAAQVTADRPNILWITIEDLQPIMGYHGYEYSKTPNLDNLASEGVRYSRAYASSPVCTPARSCIITGVHAPSQGTQHLRQEVPKSRDFRCYSEYLREAGYYCTNNVKEDYNFPTPAEAWDESSKDAHWRKRPDASQPFFSIFNLTTTHQSQTRYVGEELKKRNNALPPELRHDPADAPMPPIYPDTPLVRENIAALFTQVTVMDQQVGDILKQLEEDGLAEDTIVFFYSDHGTGLPRGKRWLHDTGLQVPFIIKFPEKYRHLEPSAPGSVQNRIISFLDLAPTLMSMLDLPIPGYMQGQAFLGKQATGRRSSFFATRDRVDEVVEFGRSVREERFHYIRNFYPHRPRMQRSWFSEITPIRKELRRLDKSGKLTGDQTWLMERSIPAEELYDTQADPLEMNNLVADPAHRATLERLRERTYSRMVEIKDTSLMPEADTHRRVRGGSPYDAVRDRDIFPVEEILESAKLVGMGVEHLEALVQNLKANDSAVRYWAAVGLAALGDDAKPAIDALRAALNDSSVNVRGAAAEALCRMGDLDTGLPVLAEIVEGDDEHPKYEVAAALLCLGKQAAPIRGRVHAALLKEKVLNAHAAIAHIVHEIDGNHQPQALFDALIKL
jgi:N-sulfoglucosamine sulfohydrolase